MNKKLYATAIIFIVAGLYLPDFMQMPVKYSIIGSVLTVIGMNTKEFFGKSGEDNE